MQLRPFYFDIQISVPPPPTPHPPPPPALLHRKLQLLMLQVFLIYAKFRRLFLSAILYDPPAILQQTHYSLLAFRLYDALKIRNGTGSFSFLAISGLYNIQNTADLRLYSKYELSSIKSFDYTNFGEYGIKSFSYSFDIW